MEKSCDLDLILEPVRGKWKAEIVYCLRDKPMRLSQIERALPGAIQRVLKRQLRCLEKDGIVQRKIYSETPPKVEYSLTEQGRSLFALLCVINKAADEYIRRSKLSPTVRATII